MIVSGKKNILLSILFFLGLIYVLSPGPNSIKDFPPIPDSLKSNEPGDTVQVPNIAAFFSEFDRDQITKFYIREYQNQFFLGMFLPPIKLNYPPRAAYQYVRDLLQRSTFLEEYVYPLHGSIFVNGYEPHVENDILGLPHKPLGDRIGINGKYYRSKTTIRFYPNYWYCRLLVYLVIWICTFLLYKLIKKITSEKSL